MEKGADGNPTLDGRETIPNAKTPPSLYGTYNFTECHSDAALTFNTGLWPVRTGQGIWLRMRTDENSSPDVLDQFRLGVILMEEV